MKKYFMILVILILSSSASADRLVRLYDVSRGSAMKLIEDGYDATNVDIRGGCVGIEGNKTSSVVPREYIPPESPMARETATVEDLQL